MWNHLTSVFATELSKPLSRPTLNTTSVIVLGRWNCHAEGKVRWVIIYNRSVSESRLYNHDVQCRLPPPTHSLSLSLCLQHAQLNVTYTSLHVLPNGLSGSTFLSSSPRFMQKAASCKVPSLHPFVLLTAWTWGTDGIIMTRKTRSKRRKPVPMPLYHVSHIDWPGIEPGLRGEKMATNRLSKTEFFTISNAPRVQK